MVNNLIIVDSREQKPLFKNCKSQTVITQKLDVGDYSTIDLLGKFCIERKSPGDLYGSIIQGHKRFRAEIMRAKATNVKLVIMVECSQLVFINKSWNRIAPTLKTASPTLAKIINTIQTKYEVEIVWCNGRIDMKKKVLERFKAEKKLLNIGN